MTLLTRCTDRGREGSPGGAHGSCAAPGVRRARSTDPTTSHDAAASAGGLAAHHNTIILEALRAGPGTKDELAERTGLDGVQICRRLTELERDGEVETTGETRPTASGRAARVWRRKPQWARNEPSRTATPKISGGLFE